MMLRIEDITIVPNRLSVDAGKVAELTAPVRKIGILYTSIAIERGCVYETK